MKKVFDDTSMPAYAAGGGTDAQGTTKKVSAETKERGTTWNGLNPKKMASVLNRVFESDWMDNDGWNELFAEYGSPYRVGYYDGGVYAEARPIEGQATESAEACTDRDHVTLAKNHVLLAIEELEKTDAYNNVRGIIGILENAEDALADILKDSELGNIDQ